MQALNIIFGHHVGVDASLGTATVRLHIGISSTTALVRRTKHLRLRKKIFANAFYGKGPFSGFLYRIFKGFFQLLRRKMIESTFKRQKRHFQGFLRHFKRLFKGRKGKDLLKFFRKKALLRLLETFSLQILEKNIPRI